MASAMGLLKWVLMNTRLSLPGLLLTWLLTACGGASEDYQAPQLPAPPEPPPPPTAEPAPLPEPYSEGATSGQPPAPPPAPAASPPPTPPPPPAATQASAQPSPPPAAPDTNGQLVYSYPTGQWVYTAGPGWVWVPSGAATVDEEGVPYVYLYTPAYGWTWYVSPWGPGPYHYGVWIRHPWHPPGWHGYWVAHPHVVVRLGGRGYSRGGYHRR